MMFTTTFELINLSKLENICLMQKKSCVF